MSAFQALQMNTNNVPNNLCLKILTGLFAKNCDHRLTRPYRSFAPVRSHSSERALHNLRRWCSYERDAD